MVDYLGVLVAAIAAYAVGALWYGPIFGTKWKSLMGIGAGTMKTPMARAMIGGFVATLVMVYVLAVFMNALAIGSASQAAWLAFVVAVGFIGTSLLNGVFYEGRSWQLWFINTGHYVVALVVAALVLSYL